MDLEKVVPSNGVLPVHPITVRLSDEEAGNTRPKEYNICRKALHAGKWQNFAAGIGTGAAYASLHGLHWHPHWVTIIEDVRHVQPPSEGAVILYRCVAQAHPLFHKHHHILRQSGTFEHQHTVCVSSSYVCMDYLISNRSIARLRQDIARKNLFDPLTPLVAPLIVLDYGTICIGVMLYAHKLGAPQTDSLQGLFW